MKRVFGSCVVLVCLLGCASTNTNAPPASAASGLSLQDERAGRAVVEEVRRTIQGAVACRDGAMLREQKRVFGRMRILFYVEPSGAVTRVSAESDTTNSPTLVECMLNLVRGFRFQPGLVAASTGYFYPYTFGQ